MYFAVLWIHCIVDYMLEKYYNNSISIINFKTKNKIANSKPINYIKKIAINKDIIIIKEDYIIIENLIIKSYIIYIVNKILI